MTYNYAWFYFRFLDKEGLEWLNGKKAKDTIVKLKAAVAELGTRMYGDYWAATPGNAGHALDTLLKWAELHPEATFEVS